MMWPRALHAASWPSLFRGVVVADSALGIRVVSVDEQSLAYRANLRPEDVVVQVNDMAIHSIDEFAVLSQSLKGRATKASLLILRNGQPRTILVHLYSEPILQRWDVAFVPEHDIRFADPKPGVEYWTNLGRGFDTANKLPDAINSYLNALHNDPQNVDVALIVVSRLGQLAREQLAQAKWSDAVTTLSRAMAMLSRMFDGPITVEQRERVKQELQSTLSSLQEANRKVP